MRTGPPYHLPKHLWPKGVRMVPRRNWNRWTVMKMSKTRKLGLESDGPEELWMTVSASPIVVNMLVRSRR